jgi:hypothetical protein
MIKTFHLKEVSLEQWNSHWQQVPKANLLQSWQYGEAKAQAEGWRVIRFLISEESSHPVALAQMLTRTIPLLGGIARLNRGPILLEEFPEDQAMERGLEALRAVLKEARRRRWWVVQIAPELPDIETVLISLKQMDLRQRPETAFASGRLALGVDEKSLLMGLNGKWRNCMRKGERLGVSVSRHEGSGPELELLIGSYVELQHSKDFHGIPDRLIRSLAAQQGKMWQFNLFVARAGNTSDSEEPIGMLVSVCHGDTATYVIGSTNEHGRQMQANSVLLWQAILHARRFGCAWFDIGGLSAITPKGVAEFKNGLNAVPYKLVGEWRWYYQPWRMHR